MNVFGRHQFKVKKQKPKQNMHSIKEIIYICACRSPSFFCTLAWFQHSDSARLLVNEGRFSNMLTPFIVVSLKLGGIRNFDSYSNRSVRPSSGRPWVVRWSVRFRNIAEKTRRQGDAGTTNHMKGDLAKTD